MQLTFEEDLKITQMFSAEEECVDLDPTLYPTGNVENWLALVENSMTNTVRVVLGKALEDLMTKERREWVLCWPGQVVIACSQTFWTAGFFFHIIPSYLFLKCCKLSLGVEQSITTQTLPDFLRDTLLVNLDALRSLVKESLTFLHREILSALIVIEVHSRDVTQTLVDLHTTNINDFDWISQVRYEYF